MIYYRDNYKKYNSFDADVCVIGSGAGGAVAAYELAAFGYTVIVVEEGGYYTTKDYNGKPLDNMKTMWRGAGSTVSFGIPPVSIPTGKCVGGTTAINSATCFRTPENIVTQWKRELNVDLQYSCLIPYFEKVEKIINVTELSWDVLGKCAKIVKRGADALGLHCRPLKHNVKNCKGCGTCQFGCVEGAKQSTEVSYIPLALKYNTVLLTHCKAEKIIFKGKNAHSVECSVCNEQGKIIAHCIIKARIVICACGSMITPLLLKKSGVKNKHIGMHLQIHPCSRVVALMDEEVNGWIGVSQGAYIDDYADEGIMLEGIFVHPSILTASLPGVGKDFFALAQQFSNIAAFGVMVHDTGQGRVFGSLSTPLSWYSLTAHDVETLKKGIAYLSEVFIAAGAREIYTPISSLTKIKSMDDIIKLKAHTIKRTHIPEVFAFHPLGTCRMAGDSNQGVVDSYGKCYGTSNLYIADGSIVPTSLGVNPQITIMALATKISHHVAEQLEKEGR
ncbi:MAG: GMC family oxidoreductase [Spirochaetes bacterium]|nr:GMC family oxidoreductase [Spirochaetota bacterium]